MFKIITASVLILFVSFVKAQNLVPTPDSIVHCTVCHGVQLNGNKSTDAPRLSELPPWYIERQINGFQTGERGVHPADHSGAEMLPSAMSISPEVLQQAIDFISKVDAPQPEITLHGDVERGKQVYLQCGACHGAMGQGVEVLNAPPLAGQNDWYLLKQLKHFKNGTRGANTKDSSIQTMVFAAQALSDEADMIDVVAYISTLNNEKEKN